MTEPPAPLVIEGPCGLVVDPYCIDEEEWDAAPPEQRRYAMEQARITLNGLTAGQVANCPEVYRPCGQKPCHAPVTGLTWEPVLTQGRWFNQRPCGCQTDCWHADAASRVRLPRPVADVDDVYIDGAALSPDEYRFYGGWLVRTDGTAWPTDQDLSQDYSEPNTFAIVYRPGFPLGPAGERALGVLVREFLRACSGKKCSLPSNMRTMSRQGVQFDIEKDQLADGVIGIREVDFYTATINPNRLKVAPAVYVPGGSRG